MTAALERGDWSEARTGRKLPTGKNQYQFFRRLGGPQGLSGWAEILVATGIRSRGDYYMTFPLNTQDIEI